MTINNIPSGIIFLCKILLFLKFENILEMHVMAVIRRGMMNHKNLVTVQMFIKHDSVPKA